MTHFADRLGSAIVGKRTPVLVGLDPRAKSLPAGLLAAEDANNPVAVANAYRTFCRGVIDAVAPLAAVVKPQAAFFEELGPAGMAALADVIVDAREQGLLVILDGKRNDIGSTAEAYASAYLGRDSAWGADALTVSPYLGDDSLAPFIERCRTHDAGIFVLVKTSNPGGGTFQDRAIDGRPLYEHVAELVEQQAAATSAECGYGAVGAVVGATYPEQLTSLRMQMPHAWLLVPGYGAQGAGARDVAGAFDDSGLGAIVNSSRGIIFAHARAPYSESYGAARWQDAVAAAARDMIEQLKSETPAGRLFP
ncbi:MAG: orotidine-5'-phosphate decarboxylase [Pirellulaceae bacterium]